MALNGIIGFNIYFHFLDLLTILKHYVELLLMFKIGVLKQKMLQHADSVGPGFCRKKRGCAMKRGVVWHCYSGI